MASDSYLIKLHVVGLLKMNIFIVFLLTFFYFKYSFFFPLKLGNHGVIVKISSIYKDPRKHKKKEVN